MAKKPSPESVKAVQKLLKEQGFYKGDISGVKNWATESAIREYQVKNKLKNTGEIDDVSADLVSKTALAKQSAQPSVKPAMPQAVDTTQGAAQYMEGNQPASAPPAPAAPQNDRVRGKGSREFRSRTPAPVPPPVPAAAVPDVPQNPAEGGNAAKIGSVVAGAVKAASEGPIRKAKAAKEAIDQKKLDARTAKEKQADDNAGKPKWTKYEEAKAKYEVRHGRPPPPNWISSASQTELADQATIPKAMRDLGVYSTYSGDTDPKTGLTKPEVWDKLFNGSGKQDEGWTEVDGGRVSADGRFQMPFGDKGRWGDVTAPMSLTLDRHFGGKDWLTKKAWSSATPDEQASMIRADAGIPTPQVWVTPTDTAAEVGADIAALDGTSVDQMTRLPVPAGARMVSGQSGSGFTTTKLPAAPPAQGAGSQAAGQLPGVPPPTLEDVTKALNKS
jgi:peptidoglycan hydrolase-like protein with peptidoglycan-binding domain